MRSSLFKTVLLPLLANDFWCIVELEAICLSCTILYVLEDCHMKKKVACIIFVLVLCVSLATPAVAASPETGVVAGDGWRTIQDVDGYGASLSVIPVVVRKILVDGYFFKAFPQTGGAGWDGDPTKIGGISYGLMEELTVPVGTSITYDATHAVAYDHFLIDELFFSHTTEDGYDFYSVSETDADGFYVEHAQGYFNHNRVFEHRGEGEGSVSFTFANEGLYLVCAFYINLIDEDEHDFPTYFVVNAVSRTRWTSIQAPVTPLPLPHLPLPETPGDLIRVVVGSTPVVFDQPPIIADGRTLVPLRAIFEAMGAEVDFDQSTQTVTAVRGDVSISLRIGSNTLVRNGVDIRLDVPAQIVGGRTLVPVRAIAESFGADVVWDQATRTVTVTE